MTVARRCPNAHMEIDLRTGLTWGNHERISVRHDMTEPTIPTYPCSRQEISVYIT